MEDAAKEASQLNFGPFEMQLREAEETRNIIEIEIKEINGRNTASPPLDNDVANIFFDKLGIRPWDASRIAMKTSRYKLREIELKAGVNAMNHINREEPFRYQDYQITAKAQSARYTRVTFRNVPLNIENEEILHLSSFFGEVQGNTVLAEPLGIANRNVKGSHRYVNIKFYLGCQFNNFYIMEGPLELDKPSRVTVTHSNQTKQCSHCLKRPRRNPQSDGCAWEGLGRECRMSGADRGDLEEFMEYVANEYCYRSMKKKPLCRNKGNSGGGKYWFHTPARANQKTEKEK